MSVRFPDVYVRPAGTPITAFSLSTGNNTLDGWDRIELGQKAVKYVIDADVKEDYNDGTIGVGSEKLSLEFGSFRAEKAHYDYLRSQFNNASVDVLLYDPNDDSCLIAFWAVKLLVSPVAEGSSSAIIKMSAQRSFGSLSLTGVITFAANSPSGVLSGYVFAADGITKLSGVTVSVTGSARSYTDTTDADGNYLMQVYADTNGITYTFTLTKSGRTFPTGQTSVAKQETEVQKNFTALT